MSADTAPLTKVDSAVDGLGTSPPKEKGHRRASSSATGVYNIADLGSVILLAPVDISHDYFQSSHVLMSNIIKAKLTI